mmetsp:Transcript_15908/g.50678  ORF Transcript_15908/g.50678 Transcript_15908/m.50678 type:complete len:287 (+) Transcript_15908:99-959(+)
MSTPLKVTTAKRDALNLSVIQRHDPSCVNVLHTVTHSVAYEYGSSGWEKLNVEGSLFLVQRATEPLHALIVLNRLGPKNVQVNIAESSSVKASPPFLMVRSTKEATTYGFWFHDEDERVGLEGALQRARDGAGGTGLSPAVASLLGRGPRPAASPPPPPASDGVGDIDEASGRALMQLLGMPGGNGEARPAPVRRAVPAPAAASVVSSAAASGSGPGSGPTPGPAPTGVAASGGASAAPGAGPLMLTKRQLQAMLIKLVQDDKFVDILHRQYMATVQRARGQSPRS